MKSAEKVKKERLDFGINVEEIVKAGLHFGHRSSKRHPKMEPFLYGVRNSVHIIDPEKISEKLKEALTFIQKLILERKTLLFVGTKVQIKDLVKKTAKDCGLPYVTERWLGGTFTNFETIKKRVEYFEDLERKKKEGGFEKYTKKEKIQIDREIEDLEEKFGGLRDLNQLPDAVFVIGMKKDNIAVKEANEKEIKVIGITDTNIDPSLTDYPIPANDDAISSVKYILDKVKKVILETQARSKKE